MTKPTNSHKKWTDKGGQVTTSEKAKRQRASGMVRTNAGMGSSSKNERPDARSPA
jgi:hypothetical protein